MPPNTWCLFSARHPCHPVWTKVIANRWPSVFQSPGKNRCNPLQMRHWGYLGIGTKASNFATSFGCKASSAWGTIWIRVPWTESKQSRSHPELSHKHSCPAGRFGPWIWWIQWIQWIRWTWLNTCVAHNLWPKKIEFMLSLCTASLCTQDSDHPGKVGPSGSRINRIWITIQGYPSLSDMFLSQKLGTQSTPRNPSSRSP